MKRFFVFTIAGAALLLSALPASAVVRPAPLAQAGGYEAVQFRFPWESRAKAKPRKRSATKPQRSRSQKPAAAARRGKGKQPPAAAAAAAAPDPLDAALPPASGPLAVTAPRGKTQRETNGWADVAGQVAPPAEPPLISADGPGPLAASAAFLLGPLRVGDQTVAPRVVARAEPEPETPDRHIPLPPMRPPAPGEPAPREGLSPEGQALAPEGVPLPPRRPDGGVAGLEPELPPKPTGPTEPDIPLPVTSHEDDADCRALESEGVVEAERIPPIEGPGVCGGGPLVSMTAVKRRDGSEMKIHPAAKLRCSMARALGAFLRDDVAPAAESAGMQLARLDIAGSFQCRGRNGATGGKMSEHGRANAVDLSGYGFSDGKALGVFASEIPKPMADTIKTAACGRFATVLGPGSDGFHENHLHLDLQPRRSKARLCEWDEPKVADHKDGDEGDDDKADAGGDDKDKGDAERRSAQRKSEHGSSKAQAAP